MPLPTSTLSRAAEFVKTYEGRTDWIYLDSEGFATFGYGFRPPLEQYLWHPNIETAKADLLIVESRKNEGVHAASYYKKDCNARLDSATMLAKLMAKLDVLATTINPKWNLYQRPVPCQIVLLDMGYNLGVAGLNKFVKFHEALDSADYAKAAHECVRKGISDGRNTAAQQLLLSLVARV